MASSSQIVLYDLASRLPGTTWSFNVWKTRALLNYLGVDYRTEWLEYPDIKPALEPHIHPPPKSCLYTVPTIRIPPPPSSPADTPETYITDSKAIAQHLQSLYPSIPLHIIPPSSPDSDDDSLLLPLLLSKTFQSHLNSALEPLWGLIFLLVPQRILNPASLPYWRETRKSWWTDPITTTTTTGLPGTEKKRKMTLEEYADSLGGIGKEPWENGRDGWRGITELLRRGQEGGGGGGGGGGPFFFRGGEFGFLDATWAGFLIFFKRLGEEQWGFFSEVCGGVEVHERFLEGCQGWVGLGAEGEYKKQGLIGREGGSN